mgnify:CR=1 FL=1
MTLPSGPMMTTSDAGRSTLDALAGDTRRPDAHVDDPIAHELAGQVLAALERNPLFLTATLPARIFPPMFNRYEGGGTYGNHVDNAVRVLPDGTRVRTDVSATLFLSDPDDYDGGELTIDDTYGTHTVKLPAGDLVIYPSTSLHRVTPVTRGARIACVFWVQSLIRDDAQRTLLLDLDLAIQRLNRSGAEPDVAVALGGTYHNLLRMWATP